MLDARPSHEALLLMLAVNLYQVRGQQQQFLRFLDNIPGGRTALWDLLEAFVWTSGAVTPDTVRMRLVLDRLRRADPAEIRRDNWVPAYEDLTVQFHGFERDYNVALLLIHLGRVAEARAVITSLKAMGRMEFLGNLQEDAIKSLEAEMLFRDGDLNQALTVLRAITYDVSHGATYHAIADASRSRFLRAELELARGDTSVAKGLHRGFDESWSPWDMYHRPVVYQRLGEIAEAEGRVTDAITQYSRLLDLWRDGDAATVATRDKVKQRRDALQSRR